MSPLTVLYRGPLESCNYACAYCPFAKRRDSRDDLARDRAALDRFVAWVLARGATTSVFFTPWGEALIRPWYQDALARLSHGTHVRRAAIQTNLSCRLDWLDRCDTSRVALWCTFHPTEVPRARFVARCRELTDRGARYSVGVVGLREHFGAIEALRRELPDGVYLWVNAFKRGGPGYYREDERAMLAAIDPLFAHNAVAHASRGEACRAGASVIAVDGDGTAARCHFVDEPPLGNVYDAGFEAAALRERACPNATCGCHIGYVHLDRLALGAVYGEGILERIALPVVTG